MLAVAERRGHKWEVLGGSRVAGKVQVGAGLHIQPAQSTANSDLVNAQGNSDALLDKLRYGRCETASRGHA